MVPSSQNRRSTGTDRRAKPRKGQGHRRAGERGKKPAARIDYQQKMMFPMLLFIAYLLIARPVSEPKISAEQPSCGVQTEEVSEIEPVESDRGPASIKSAKPKREKMPPPVAKKKEKPQKVSAKKPKFKPRDDIGPSVTFSGTKEEPIVIDDALKATTAEMAKGRFPANIQSAKPAAPAAPPAEDVELDVSDDFTAQWKKK